MFLDLNIINMSVKDNIYLYLESKKISPTKAERELKWSVGALTKANSITSDRLKEFILFYKDVSAEWLLTGNGNMIKKDVNSSEQNKKDVVISREVFNQISQLTETIYSQQKTIESMENERKKILAQTEPPAICANVSG